MQFSMPAEQALGVAELIQAVTAEKGEDLTVLFTMGDGGLTARPVVVAFTDAYATNVETYEVNVAGTAEVV